MENRGIELLVVFGITDRKECGTPLENHMAENML